LNPEAYYYSLGPEIYKELNGKVDYFVCAGSTGGTISGVAKYLKEKNKNCKVILADPFGSIFYDRYKYGVLKE